MTEQKSKFCIGSTETVSISELAPRSALQVNSQLLIYYLYIISIVIEHIFGIILQNIQGLNWPSPPMSFSHVTYCYIDNDQSQSIQNYAKDLKAEFRQEAVRVDGGR